MRLGESFQLKVDTRKIVLSSTSLFYKTEKFIKLTQYVSNIDNVLDKLAGGILLFKREIETLGKNKVYKILTKDKRICVEFVFGASIKRGLNSNDIVFCGYNAGDKGLGIRMDEYVRSRAEILIEVLPLKDFKESPEFNKLYGLSLVSGVNLPRLTAEQRAIVQSVDKNILVQGVAGSGKTNICIDKIIFTASRNYSGKTLYTTFSRGLIMDTKLKIEAYKSDLRAILDGNKNENLVFVGNDHKVALENRLGIFFDSNDDDRIFEKVQKVLCYLEEKVDYLLLEDIYRAKFGDKTFVGQEYFINTYSNNLTNHQVTKAFEKLGAYSKEVVYKEIFGMIYGVCDKENVAGVTPLDKYIKLREGSFEKSICEAIYQIAMDYGKHLDLKGLKDNNIASREIMSGVSDFEYSLAIIDEVQDYTQINLSCFKALSLKMFCVGDALQMINPSYFSFSYLKTLLYDDGLTDLGELKHNYRNTEKIERIVSALTEINRGEFGVHNFIVDGKSVDSGLKTLAVYLKAKDFASRVANSGYDNFTFIVCDQEEKEQLKKIISNQEVLTVGEIKGLERNTIVVYNVLSKNIDKWNALSRISVNRKTADENSVYRYYYNLFYVALTRAKQNIFVVEGEHIDRFRNFFKENFDVVDTATAIKKLNQVVSKVEFTQTEAVQKSRDFIGLGQYDNAKFMAKKIKDDAQRISIIREIEVGEKYVSKGHYREAGIAFWEYGMLDEAKKMFVLSNDNMLIELVDKCSNTQNKDLNIGIIEYYNDIKDNDIARNFILETAKRDAGLLKRTFEDIKEKFKRVGK